MTSVIISTFPPIIMTSYIFVNSTRHKAIFISLNMLVSRTTHVFLVFFMKHEHLLLMHVNNNDLCAFLMVNDHGFCLRDRKGIFQIVVFFVVVVMISICGIFLFTTNNNSDLSHK